MDIEGMNYSDVQKALGFWKPSRKKVKGRNIGRLRLCRVCLNEGFKVKMDFVRNEHRKSVTARYNYDVYNCPRCMGLGRNHVAEECTGRIDGKGKSGVDAGKLLGNK